MLQPEPVISVNDRVIRNNTISRILTCITSISLEQVPDNYLYKLILKSSRFKSVEKSLILFSLIVNLSQNIIPILNIFLIRYIVIIIVLNRDKNNKKII